MQITGRRIVETGMPLSSSFLHFMCWSPTSFSIFWYVRCTHTSKKWQWTLSMHQIILVMNSLSIIFVGCYHHGKLLLVLFKWRGCDVIKCRYSQFSKYVEYCRRKSKRNDSGKLFQIHLQCSFYFVKKERFYENKLNVFLHCFLGTTSKVYITSTERSIRSGSPERSTFVQTHVLWIGKAAQRWRCYIPWRT